jgi:Ca2+-binding RTX toxin-like protein
VIDLVNDATVSSELLDGASFTITGAGSGTSVLTVSLATAADVDLSGIDASDSVSSGADFSILGGTGANTIIGTSIADDIDAGAGVDEMTGGDGDDVFIFDTLDTGITVATADTITDFTTTEDSIDLNGYVSGASTYTEADGSAVASFAALIALADAALGTVNEDVYVSYNALGTGDAYVFFDADASGAFTTGDTLIILTGVSAAADIIAADFV